MGPLEYASVEELVRELQRRSTASVVALEFAPLKDTETPPWSVYVEGGTPGVLGLASLAQLRCTSFAANEMREHDRGKKET